MPRPRSGLGRGLDAIIPAPEALVEEVDVDFIVANPRQPRLSLDQEALRELADSIREHGVLQPLLVTEVGSSQGQAFGGYQIIAGERRWQAAKMAGLARVPVVIKEANPREMLELALVENLQRSDLNPLEEAGAYRQLTEDFGLTQEEVARRVGKSRPTVANSLRLLGLSEEVKKSLARGEISGGHARALLGLKEESSQRRLLARILRKHLSVRQTEEAVKRWHQERKVPRAPSDPETQEIEDRFRAALGTKVRLVRGRRGGRLIIHFYTEEELQGLYDLIVR